MIRKRAPGLVGLFTALSAITIAQAAQATPPVARPIAKVGGTALRAMRTGVLTATSRVKTGGGVVPVMIELEHAATQADFDALTAHGARLVLAKGIPIAYDRFVAARIDEKAARAVAALATVKRVGLAASALRAPLDHSAELLHLDDARGSVPAMDRLTGQGITIGDEDSLVDIFEPAFFRGDAGYYDWLDVDKDGVYTPNVDAIDLNQNGVVDDGEVGLVITAQPLDETTGQPLSEPSVRSISFDPGLDWVYLDSNGNKTRDYGPAAGFDETTPAYGEPLFTPDDVNRNGKLDVGERFVRLGTSKFKMVRVSLSYPKKVNAIYTRGVDLIKTPTDITGGALYGFDDAYHATGVSTILAGDLPLVGRRWVGIAPDADLLTSFDVESTGTGLPIQGVAWLLQQKPDVMLHELALWADVPLDGSDQLSAMIDTSVTKDNVIETCPTGDQGSALKHTRSLIAAAGTSSLKFSVPEHTIFGTDPLTYVGLSLNVTGGDFASASVTLPSSDTLALSNNAQGTIAGGAQYYITDETTSRGTHFWNVVLYAQAAGAVLPTGDFMLNATAGTAPLTLDAYIEDDKSSWAIGAAWDKAIATDAFTVGVPSVADHCIAVGAAPDHPGDAANPWYDLTFYAAYDVPAGYEETQNQVRAYSPRGPRIDGVMKPDILAPDNPWVAMNHTAKSTNAYGTYFPFGGTSGASPHVTGVGALLAQAGIKGDAARDAIRKGADHDGSEGSLPNGDYGYGHLNAAKALGVTTDGITPTVTLTANPSTVAVGAQAQLTAAVSGGDGLQVKYDDDYDGTWNTDYAAADPRGVTATAPGVRHFKVRVRNSSGRIAEAVTSITFTAADATGSDDGGGCGCRTTNDRASTAGSLGVALAALLVLRRKRRAAQV